MTSAKSASSSPYHSSHFTAESINSTTRTPLMGSVPRRTALPKPPHAMGHRLATLYQTKFKFSSSSENISFESLSAAFLQINHLDRKCFRFRQSFCCRAGFCGQVASSSPRQVQHAKHTGENIGLSLPALINSRISPTLFPHYFTAIDNHPSTPTRPYHQYPTLASRKLLHSPTIV